MFPIPGSVQYQPYSHNGSPATPIGLEIRAPNNAVHGVWVSNPFTPTASAIVGQYHFVVLEGVYIIWVTLVGGGAGGNNGVTGGSGGNSHYRVPLVVSAGMIFPVRPAQAVGAAASADFSSFGVVATPHYLRANGGLNTGLQNYTTGGVLEGMAGGPATYSGAGSAVPLVGGNSLLGQGSFLTVVTATGYGSGGTGNGASGDGGLGVCIVEW